LLIHNYRKTYMSCGITHQPMVTIPVTVQCIPLKCTAPDEKHNFVCVQLNGVALSPCG
jgi:hypothetical protein